MNWKKKKRHNGVGEWKWLTASYSKVKMWNLKEEGLDFPPHNHPKKKKKEEGNKFWIQKWEKVQEKWNCEI